MLQLTFNPGLALTGFRTTQALRASEWASADFPYDKYFWDTALALILLGLLPYFQFFCMLCEQDSIYIPLLYNRNNGGKL